MKSTFKSNIKRFFSLLSLVLLSVLVRAQDGNSGIQEATNKVKGYFDTGCDLMYAIGAVIGIIGAVKVYSKWNAGDQTPIRLLPLGSAVVFFWW
jgi:hypothetical protein